MWKSPEKTTINVQTFGLANWAPWRDGSPESGTFNMGDSSMHENDLENEQ